MLGRFGIPDLLIDADHQCMSGELLLGEERLLKLDHRRKTLHDLLAAMLDDEFSADQIPFYVWATSPTSEEAWRAIGDPLFDTDRRLLDQHGQAKRGFHSNDEFLAIFRRRRETLRRWLRTNFDFTIVDCPPSIALQVKVFLTVGDFYIIPSIPDRLSVRGSIYLLDRIQKLGLKVAGLGTLWSLYREQNPQHRRTVEVAAKRTDPYYKQLPLPFKTIIPNAAAIAEATEPGRNPKTFTAKYTSPFAKLFRSLCEEIVTRSQSRQIPSQARRNP